MHISSDVRAAQTTSTEQTERREMFQNVRSSHQLCYVNFFATHILKKGFRGVVNSAGGRFSHTRACRRFSQKTRWKSYHVTAVSAACHGCFRHIHGGPWRRWRRLPEIRKVTNESDGLRPRRSLQTRAAYCLYVRPTVPDAAAAVHPAKKSERAHVTSECGG